MSRLRSYTSMRKVSKKREEGKRDFDAVYRQVDSRSDGQCEFQLPYVASGLPRFLRCRDRAMDHHHCIKPRASHHDANLIVHLCRGHHDRCDWPYLRGRLVVTPLGQGRFDFSIRFSAHQQGDAPAV